MTDAQLIKKSKIAWHDDKMRFILLPIYATEGTHLLDIGFEKEGHEWVGRIHHDQMVELVQAAEVLREKSND
jgi:hypothetical protein